MKKQNINSIARHFFAGSILAALAFMGFSNKATAQNQLRPTIISTDTASSGEKVQIKYLGSTEDGVFFSVKYANTNGTGFTLFITDDDGELLYQSSYSDRAFNKKFNISRSLDKIKVVIKNDKEKLEQSFAININTRLVEDYVVRRD